MGRSTRRPHKKGGVAKVSRGKRKRPLQERAKVPLLFGQGTPLEPPAPSGALDPAAAEAEWTLGAPLGRNYAANGLALKANKLEPRGGLERAGRAEERPRRKRHLEDEIAGAVGRQRSTGKRAPQQLAATQRRVVAALFAAHGEDVGAMAKDIKLNKMQHSAGVLRKMVASFRECAPCSVAT